MDIIINGQTKTIPSSLSEMTLGQRIDFQIAHGNELQAMLKSIMEMPDETERELEMLEYSFEKMFRAFSFFTDTPIDALKESEFVDDIANIYFASLKTLLDDEEQLEHNPQQAFVWDGVEWFLSAPELKHGDQMIFGELIDAKQTVKDMIELSKSKWEMMLPLAAIYLRKRDEVYDKAFLYEDSERLQLMRGLPFDIALQVGFFLINTINIYQSISPSFSPAESKAAEPTAKNISNGLDG